MLSALMLTAALAGCGSSNAPASSGSDAGSGFGTSTCGGEVYKVAIVQPMSHTSLDQIRDTIVAKLNASGKEVEITTENANGDTSALTTILSNCKAQWVDLVIPIATSTAQSAKTVFEDSDIPMVFAAVSDPVAAGLTGEGCHARLYHAHLRPEPGAALCPHGPGGVHHLSHF